MTMGTNKGYSDEEVEALVKSGKATAVEPKQGFSDEDVAALAAEGKAREVAPSTTADMVETGLRSTAEGLTLGLSEPTVSGAIAVKNQIKQALDSGTLDPLSIDNFVKQYQQDAEQRMIQKAQNPGLDIGGQVIGSIAPILFTGGAALGVKGAATAAKLARGLDVGAQIGSKAAVLAKPIAKAAQIAEGAALASKGGKTLEGAAKLGAGAVKLGASAAETAAGAVAQEASRQAILKSTGFMKPGEGPDLDEVAMVGAALPVVGKGVGLLARGTKALGKGSMTALLGASPKAIDDYVKNYDTLQNARNITELKDAAQSNVAIIKNLAKKGEEGLATDVLDHLDILGNRATQASGEAYDLLTKSGQSFDSAQLIDAVEKAKQDLLTGGKTLVGAANKNSYAKLETIQNDIRVLGEQFGGTVPADTTKEIVQALDQEYNELARGEFATTAATAVNKARRNINEVLKTVDGYADKMKEVAALTDLRSRVFKEFGGSEKKAVAGVSAALKGNPTRMKLLQEFDAAQPFGLEQTKAAKAAADEINLLSESNIGDKISSFVQGSNDPKLRQQLVSLAALSDDQLVKELEALRAHEAFNTGFIRGSRNVNLGLAISYALAKGTAGAAAGMTLGPGMAGLGATYGVLVDTAGPRIARGMLKGYLEIKGIPTVAKIRSLTVPEDVKRLMIQDLSRAMRPALSTDKEKEKALNSFYAPEKAKPVIISEIRRSQGLTPEEKASMIQEVTRTGKVVDFDKVVFAGEEPKKSKAKVVDSKTKKPALPSDSVQEYFQYKKKQAF